MTRWPRVSTECVPAKSRKTLGPKEVAPRKVVVKVMYNEAIGKEVFMITFVINSCCNPGLEASQLIISGSVAS